MREERERDLRRFQWIILLTLILLGMALSASATTLQGQEQKTDHRELKKFKKFLDNHSAIAEDLKKDPSVINNQSYLAQHPDLEKYLEAHPGLREEILSKYERCSTPVPSIFDRVSPAVAFISATTINPYRVADRVEHIIGSGFIFDDSGLVLTNSHVAFNRQSIVVTLDDGTSLPAQLVGADPIFDIAVLHIMKPDKGTLPTAVLGDSDYIHVGDEALAIGNPLGFDQSLTRGTVSATNRILPETFFSFEEPLIQIDTPINPGNSGGPLLNRCGEVIGITTSMIPDAHNIGFAVPINLAKAVIPSLLEHGHLVRPWLGFHGQFIDSGLQSLLRVPLAVGFLVEVVEPGSPAEQAGIRGGGLELTIAGRNFLIGGDIITKLNGTPLTSPENVLSVLDGIKIGATVNLTVFREGKSIEVQYTLPERPLLPGDIPGQAAAAPLAGKVQRSATLRRSPLRL